MDEREKLERGSNPAAPELDENETRSVGDLIASLILDLGVDRAMLWGAECVIAPAASGRRQGLPGGGLGNARGNHLRTRDGAA